MKMKNIVLIAATSVALSACIFSSDDGDKPQQVWSRKGQTSEQVRQQLKLCKQTVNSQRLTERKRNTMFRKCMYDKGYRYGAPQ